MVYQVLMVYWLIGMALIAIGVNLEKFAENTSARREKARLEGTWMPGPLPSTIFLIFGSLTWPMLFVFIVRAANARKA